MARALTREVRASLDAEGAARSAAAEIASFLAAGEETERVTVVLAGGSTPRGVYHALAGEHAGRIRWDRVHLFFGDERCVPSEDPLSNYAMARESLISRIPVPDGNVHRIPAEIDPPAEAARHYEDSIRSFFGRGPGGPPPRFDLVLLGVGADGHTASLFPGHDALEERSLWVAAVHSAAVVPPWRITLTLPVLDNARQVFFVVTGAAKAAVVRAILRDAPEARRYPAARVRGRERTVWFADRAALGDENPWA